MRESSARPSRAVEKFPFDAGTLCGGNAGRSANAIITASTAPVWSTAAGSLGSAAGNFSGTVATVAATSDSAITYSEISSPAVLNKGLHSYKTYSCLGRLAKHPKQIA